MGEVQLIVSEGININVANTTNNPLFGFIGSQRIIVNAFNNQATIVGQAITLINTAGQTNTRTVVGIQADTPSPGLTRINFATVFTFDFTLAAGGYFVFGDETQYYLDLFENESISQNWKFQDLNTFTAQGGFSREFRVPFSATNQLALGALFDVNVDAGAQNYFHYKLPAEIRVDTLPIATGYVRVRKVYKQLNRINEVELAFYSETPDLVRNIGEKKLKDILDLPNLNEVIETANIITNTERIWTLCDRAQLWSDGGEVGTRSLTLPNSTVYPSDLTPAVKWSYLFREIIKDAGFELVAGTLDSIMSEYYMPWCNTQRLIASDSFNELFFRAYNSAPVAIGNVFATIPINTELFDNSGDFNAGTNTYVSSGGGFYNFHAIVKFANTAPNPFDIVISLSINGVTDFNEMYIGQVDNNSVIDCSLRVAIPAGASVQLKVLGNAQSLAFLSVTAGNGTFNETLFEINETVLFYGQTIFYDLNAPDMKQIDFVTDVIKMHNCAIVPDRAVPNKIYIVPQNSYLGSGNVLDWTSKLDISKDVTISSTTDLQKAKFQFTYTAGSDILSTTYKKVNRVYGDYEQVGYTINPATAVSDFAIGDQKIQLVTQSTPSGVVIGNGFIIPMFFNDKLEFVAPGPRCLFDAAQYNVRFFRDDINAFQMFGVRALNNYSVAIADIDDFDLNWAPEVPPHTIIANPYGNLFNLYWRTYMNALYSPDARIMEASFALSLLDIVTFQFSDKIWIQDCYWRILEVSDYKVGDVESTKVKLLKFLEDVEDCEGTPNTISVNGEVNFVDANGDPIAASQDCCARYGYNYQEATATCWAFTSNGGRPNTTVGGTTTSPASRPSRVAAQTRSITNSVITGDKMTIAEGNSNMLAVGERLELTKDVRGSNLLGKNVTTNLPGIHIGGGYRAGNPATTEDGWSQFGQFALHRYATIAAPGTFNFDIEGVTGEYIDMPDDTVWSCIFNVTIRDVAGDSETSLHHFTLTKLSGLASASAITTLSTIGAIGAYVFVFGIDTATNTDEHRINVTVSGGAYPTAFIMTTSLQYQQNKIS